MRIDYAKGASFHYWISHLLLISRARRKGGGAEIRNQVGLLEKDEFMFWGHRVTLLVWAPFDAKTSNLEETCNGAIFDS